MWTPSLPPYEKWAEGRPVGVRERNWYDHLWVMEAEYGPDVRRETERARHQQLSRQCKVEGAMVGAHAWHAWHVEWHTRETVLAARAEKQRATAQAEADRIELARRKEVWRERFERLSATRRASLPPYAEWLAWQWAHGATQSKILDALGRPHGRHRAIVTVTTREYIEAYLPELLIPPRWGDGPPELPADRRAVLLAHFGDRPEPPQPEPLPTIPTRPPRNEADRNWQIYEQRLSGRTLESVGKEFGVSKERVRQIFLRQDRHERHRAQREATAASIRRINHLNDIRRHGRNLGRPIDMGGPRDVWIDYDIAERLLEIEKAPPKRG